MKGVETVGFIGSSGTGKSHRANEVAKNEKIEYIIDDGILIHQNRVLAGLSAKLARTRIGSLKRAVFYEDEHCEEVKRIIRNIKPESILILGTSDKMVDIIAERLSLPPIARRIYIDEVASDFEQRMAKNTRMNKGTHVIPVATFELKPHFSGLLLDPLKWMNWKGRIISNYESERSVVRPTFSMLGNFTITDFAIQQLVKHAIIKNANIQRVTRVSLRQFSYGLSVNVEIVMYYGEKLKPVMRSIQQEIAKEIETTTALFVLSVDLTVAGLVMRKEHV